MKHLFKDARFSRWPAYIFLVTVLYGMLHMDGGDSFDSVGLSYGWFFIFFLLIPVWGAYCIAIIANLIRVLHRLKEDTDKVERQLDYIYFTIVMLLALQIFGNFTLYAGLYAFGTYIGWSTICQLILLMYVDYLWYRPWKRKSRAKYIIYFLGGAAVLFFVASMLRLSFVFSSGLGFF